jgi:hypothetical protein
LALNKILALASQLTLLPLTQIIFIKKQESWAQVAHACNPSYSGGSDQEDHGSKPAQANSS